MSWQDFTLGVLASILAAIICDISKYVHFNLKRFLATVKALAYPGKLKVYLFFSFYQAFFLDRVKLDKTSLERRFFFSPISLSIVIFISLMVFTPFVVNRNEEHQRGVVHISAGKDGNLIAEDNYPLTYRSERDSVRATYRINGLGRGSVTVSATTKDGRLLAGGDYALTYRTE